MINDDEARCPYCYEEQTDSWEYAKDGAASKEIIGECGTCSARFKISVDYTAHYYTYKITEQADN